MKNIFVLIGILFCFTSFAKAAVNFGDHANIIDIQPVISLTTSADSTTGVDMRAYSGRCRALVDTKMVSGDATAGLAMKLKESATSGGSYTDVSGGAFASVTSADVSQSIVFNKDNQMRYLKLNRVISGNGGPVYLLSGKIVCEKKYKN